MSTLSAFQLHAVIFKVGFQSHVYVQTALVHVYAVCGCLVDAMHAFDEMPERNIVTWNVLITGLTKWGQLQIARSLFDQMPTRTVVSWTGIIDGYTRMNRPNEALALFQRMVVIDVLEPTEITLLAIFPAISNLGALKLCQSCHAYGEKKGFNSSDIRVTNSLIDSYAKWRLEEAEKMALEIPAEIFNVVIWRTLLGACSFHGNAEMGERVTMKILEMERAYGGDYVLMSNIFAGVGKFGDAERLALHRNLKDISGSE
nr:pentatricopeptide repeat-containing protein, mitochondrial [Quercus suber]